jgi:4-hydroxy-3-polyprenylbenzoate decarboxylase
LCRLFLDPQGRHDHEKSDAQILLEAVAAPLRPQMLERPLETRSIVKKPDIRTLLPALTYAVGDPGPTITLGLVYARDEQTGVGNCSFHRITLKERSVVIGIYPGGHLQRLIDLHVARGERLPISINVGLDPAIHLASVLSNPSVEFGFDELGVAGSIRKKPVPISRCFSNRGWFIDHAEVTIEASIGAEKEFESTDGCGHSMPEYLGYFSPCGMVSSLEVTAVTFRPGAMYQTLSGPGSEQSALLGIGQECAVFARLVAFGATSLVRSVVSLPSGGGHLLTVLQVSKGGLQDDEGVLRVSAALLEQVPSLKNLILVDEDVNASSAEDVLWAMATRSRLDIDVHASAVLRGTPLDPTQSSHYASEGQDGFTRKCVIDCTVPFALRRRFRRAFPA